MESKPKLKIEKIYKDAIIPNKPVTNTDSGYDIYAYNVKKMYIHGGGNSEAVLVDENLRRRFIGPNTFELQCNERVLIGTGIKATVAEGYEIQVRPKSGISLKKGLTVLNTPGTLDFEYRNEICVIIVNTSRAVQTITLGEAIAQLVPCKVELLEVEETTLEATTRGNHGFGDEEPVPKKKETPFNIPKV